MHPWRESKDPRFSLIFRYPEVTPLGHSIEKTEHQQNGVVRIHLLSRPRKELYFEVTKYLAFGAEAEFRQHKVDLEKRFHDLRITELSRIDWKSLPAYAYSFEWSDGARSVILVEREDATYRILYDPHSSLNERILATIEWVE